MPLHGLRRIHRHISIEQALIAKGYAEELKLTKDELEKSCFQRQGTFDHLFIRPVKDVFIDWNFKEDKSLMAIVLS